MASSLLRACIIPVLLGMLLIGLRIAAIGDGPTSLLSDGRDNPAHALITRDFGVHYEAIAAGFDGPQFYAIARHRFDPAGAADQLDVPSYRLRRILYPFLAGLIAPNGGTILIWAMAAVSLAGIAIGGFALDRLPGAPPWLPLMMVLNPGVIVALWLSLGDALATGLLLGAFAALFSKRTAAAIALLALACLTREVSWVGAFALMFTPGLRTGERAAVGVLPAIPLGLWSLWAAHATGGSVFAQPDGGTFTLPFLGWIDSGSTTSELIMAAALALLIIVALTKFRTAPLPVTIYLAASLGMLVCSTPVIMSTWFGSTRVVAPALPLAVWAIIGRDTAERRALSPTANRRKAPLVRAG